MPVSVSEKATCPKTCPFRGSGCYAEHGPINIHWSKVSSGARGVPWSVFCDQIAALPPGQLWRHNAAGDMSDSHSEWRAVTAANRGRRGFTYTHRRRLGWIREANLGGFAVNVSCESLEDARNVLDMGLPAVVVTRGSVRAGDVVVCPAVSRDGVTCLTCGLCANADRDVIVAFPVHGAGVKRAAQQVAD